jgi:8-oxo-dGTP pyrophosphatase MutT (NUDIX family)/phosphohistidine phosphatase SixA
MPDRHAAAEVRAAGAVVWRPAGRGAQVAVIHRQKYDDWSFAKGKVDPGEHVLLTAVREVAEETGLTITLGRPLPPVRYSNDGVPKRVDYWLARAEVPAAGFTANDEVDELDWLAASRAVTRLSYERDSEILAKFRNGPWQTSPLIVVRHGSAGSKSDWRKDDASRPLDSRGKKDARQLDALLRCFGSGRVLSAPATRCVATVRPYASATGSRVEVEAAFGLAARARDVPAAQQQAASAAALAAADPRPAVICAHRENLPAIIAAACAELRAPVPEGGPLRKGEFLVLHRADGVLAGFERHHPADVALPAGAGHQRAAARRSAQASSPTVSRTMTLAWPSAKLCSDTSVSRADERNSASEAEPQDTMVAFTFATVAASPSLRSPA